MSQNNRLSIVVVSYDGYSDLWNDFFKLKKQNWPDCPFNTYLVNNCKSFNDKGVKVINCGKNAQWSDRARYALEKIDTPYVCMMVEDFFISGRIDNAEVQNALDIIERNKLRFYKIQTMSKIATPQYESISFLHTIPSNLKYGISLTTAIWERRYLLDLIGKKSYNPWRFEIARVEEAIHSPIPAQCLGVFDERDIFHICHMVVQGKFIPSALKEMERKGYMVDTTHREVLKGIQYLRYKMKQLFAPLARKMPWLRNIGGLIGIVSLEKRERRR